MEVDEAVYVLNHRPRKCLTVRLRRFFMRWE